MKIAVTTQDAVCELRAKRLAKDLSLPFVRHIDDCFTHVVELTPEHLQCLATRDGAPGTIYVDFASGQLAHRLKHSGKGSEVIARAVGLHKKSDIRVLDATAGLGRDAFILASLGCHVTLVEKNPVLAALLRDGLERATAHPDVSAIAQRMHLIEADAVLWMKQSDAFDVVYLDPMFPARRKSALVKKEMRLLQELAGHERELNALFHAACICASRRVVVKRPRLGESVLDRAPNFHLDAGVTRFDVYLI